MNLPVGPARGPFCCPTEELWSEFWEGTVDEAVLQTMSQHLLDCTQCESILDALSSSQIPVIKPCLDSPFLEEANFRLLEERLKSNWLLLSHDYNALSAKSRELHCPSSLGRFLIKGVLGTGGFGRVYLAEDPLLQRTVAIKAPRRDELGVDLVISSFLVEARHAAALDHPLIVPIYDVIADQSGRTLIVMKYVAGESVSDIVRSGTVEIARAVKWMIQVSNAVHFAHERGFVHRDLKPSNILVDQQGQPHITDFGLVMDLRGDQRMTTLSGGTPPYMSPEQVRNDKDTIDRRSDIWSLGVMLAELVHGQRPFANPDRKALFVAIATAEPAIESTSETIELDAIIRKCLAKQPAHRFADAAELALELSGWLERYSPTGLAKWRYGWRKNFAVVVSLSAIVAALSFVHFRSQRLDLNNQLRLLESSPADQIAVRISRLRKSGTSFKAVASFRMLNSASAKLRFTLASVALGDADPKSIQGLTELIKTAQADEVVAVVKTLSGLQVADETGKVLSQELQQVSLSADKSLPIAAALAGLHPNHPKWKELGHRVAQLLVQMQDKEQDEWFPLFAPIGMTHLADSLKKTMTALDSSRIQQTTASIALARYFSEDVPSLVELLQVADPEEMPPLVESLSRNRSVAVLMLKSLFYDLLPETQTVREQEEVSPSQTELILARLAIGLWMIGDPFAALDAFRHAGDPTLQTLVIHGLTQQKTSIDSILEHLSQTKNQPGDGPVGVRFSLLQVLALLGREAVPPTHEPRLRDLLNELWRLDPDCGVRSSARLVCERFGIDLTELEESVEQVGWRVDRIGGTIQDFVIIQPCRADLGIGDPGYAKLLTAPWKWHERTFSRKLAVATNELTIQQVLDVEPEFPLDPMLMDSARDSAMMMLTLDSAYRICNRLSEISSLDLCYELRPTEEGVAQLVPRRNHLELSGYRLLTDGEWELACRAGTATSRYFGNAHELIPSYGWVMENIQHGNRSKNNALTSQRVGLFLPNRWGLFDMYGNAIELCDKSRAPSSASEDCHDEIVPHDHDFRRSTPMLRGGSFTESGEIYSKSHSRTERIVVSSIRTVGFRLARTLTLSQ